MTDLFNASQSTQTEVTPQPQAPAADQLLASLVNEQGKQKYSSVDDALKALINSQNHIKTLEQENQQLREVSTKAKTMEELLEAIKPKDVVAPVVPNPTPTNSAVPDVSSEVEKVLARLEAKKTAEANTGAVVNKLKELHGDKAGDYFYAEASKLGFDKASINDLAAKNPNAVFKLLGIDSVKTQTPSPAGVRAEALNVPSTTPTKSPMAHNTSDELLSNWEKSKAKTNKKLGLE